MSAPDDKPDLGDASNTDEVYRLAYDLTAWGLRHGECDELTAVDWTLGHPHEDQLPRGTHGRPNRTRHHVVSGAEAAVEKYEPWNYRRRDFNPEPLHELAARVEGSGVRHERYLLAAVALCFKYETLTPVITGPALSEITGVNTAAAGKVLKSWSENLADGFFTGVSYDGQRGHGRVWTVDPSWTPTSRLTHEPGCNRAKSRCKCEAMVSQNSRSIFAAAKDRSTKVRQFEEWVRVLGPSSPITAADTAKQLGITRAAAVKLLREAEGSTLKTGTVKAGRVRKRDPDGRWRWGYMGETWFTADPDEVARRQARTEQAAAEAARRLEQVSPCSFTECADQSPAGQRYCPEHEEVMQRLRATPAPD